MDAQTEVIVYEEYLDDTARAIQEKLDTTDKFSPSEFGDSIRSIPSGGTDGQFFPMDLWQYMIPTIIITVDGEED